nr:ribonuclease H-like domain-containing protein [Tanacetum cinerariifolium]
MAGRLANLEEKVSDKNLVMYALNGLDTWYKGIARLIRQSQPLPKFETARNMLLLEESNLQEATDQANTYDSSSSSPTVFMETKMDTKGIVKPIDRLSLHTTSISPLPKSPFLALQNPYSNNAMHDEYNVLVKNGTWILVQRPAGINLVRSMWLFKQKFHADGTLSRYKACLVANGSSQQLGIDCDETFSPVVKPATIHIVLSLAVSRKWPIHQLDVKNAFLNGDLSETVYMHQPPGFVDPCHCDYSLFILRQGSQKKYVIELFARAHMTNCNPSRTLVDTNSKLGPEGVPVQDPTLYRSLAGGLQYLTFTRPDISYAVQQICLYMHDPHEPHLADLKRILRYIRGTLDFRFHLYSSTTISLVGYTVHRCGLGRLPLNKAVYFRLLCFLGDNLLSWSSKRQQTISRSSAEAEYRGVANVVAETAWLRNLLRELHFSLSAATLVCCDNVSATYLSANPVQHQRTKHIEIDIHFVRDLVTASQVRVLHVPSRYQYADIFTKEELEKERKVTATKLEHLNAATLESSWRKDLVALDEQLALELEKERKVTATKLEHLNAANLESSWRKDLVALDEQLALKNILKQNILKQKKARAGDAAGQSTNKKRREKKALVKRAGGDMLVSDSDEERSAWNM